MKTLTIKEKEQVWKLYGKSYRGKVKEIKDYPLEDESQSVIIITFDDSKKLNFMVNKSLVDDVKAIYESHK